MSPKPKPRKHIINFKKTKTPQWTSQGIRTPGFLEERRQMPDVTAKTPGAQKPVNIMRVYRICIGFCVWDLGPF